MGNEVPSSSTVAVVVEPRAEDDVSGGKEEDTDHMLVAVLEVKVRFYVLT